MDYARHYQALICRAALRGTPRGYSERHHVVPRCIGGGDQTVRLTAEEHYVAHQLLVKIRPDSTGLIWAANAMAGTTRAMDRGNKSYGWLRRRLAERLSMTHKGRKHSPETIAKMAAAKRGKKRAPHSEQTKQKMAAASQGRPKSHEHRAALSAAKTGRRWSPRQREAIMRAKGLI